MFGLPGLGLLTGLAPRVIAIVVAVILSILLGYIVYQRVEMAGIRSDLTKVTGERDETLRAFGRLQTVVATQSAAIATQNAAVTALAGAAATASKKADDAATAALHGADAERKAIKANKGSGPKDLNSWMRDSFQR